MADEQFKIGKGRSEGRARLNAELSKTLIQKTSAQWVEILLKAGIPCGPIYGIDQVFADPQVQHLGAIGKVTHPELGELSLLNQSIALSRTPATMVASSPIKGQHTSEVLREIGYSDLEIEVFTNNHVIE